MNVHNTYPFVTIVHHGGNTYYGIIKIKSKQYTTLYCFNNMNTIEQETLLELANNWWWQSNRLIPISLFFREEMEDYEEYTIRFDTSSITEISGPQVSFNNFPAKRIKRRNVALKKR